MADAAGIKRTAAWARGGPPGRSTGPRITAAVLSDGSRSEAVETGTPAPGDPASRVKLTPVRSSPGCRDNVAAWATFGTPGKYTRFCTSPRPFPEKVKLPSDIILMSDGAAKMLTTT